MSDPSIHSGTTTELDASVDALADQIGAPVSDSHADAQAPEPTAPAEPAVATIDPPAAAASDRPSDVSDADQASAEALLAAISAEIERTNPGPLPTPPEPPPAAAPSSAASATTLPSDDDIAAAAAEVDADLGAFEAPSAAEVASAKQPVQQPEAVAPEQMPPEPAEQPAALDAQTPSPGARAEPPVARPGPEIKKLDAALAAGAERALATARAEAPPVKAPEPEVIPELPEETPEPIVVAEPSPPPPAPKPEVKVAPATKPVPVAAASSAPQAAPEPVAAKPGFGSRVFALLTLPLRPLVVVHEKFSEPTRQTIGYCAIITLFFGACVWGKVLFLPAKSQLEPKTEAVEFYDESTPAHGVTAPPKHAAEPAKGEAGGEHGEAKKADAHEKTSAKKSSSGEHAAKPEKKPSHSKKTASAEGHGGH